MSHIDTHPFFVPEQQFTHIEAQSCYRPKMKKAVKDEKNIVNLDAWVENDIERTEEHHPEDS